SDRARRFTNCVSRSDSLAQLAPGRVGQAHLDNTGSIATRTSTACGFSLSAFDERHEPIHGGVASAVRWSPITTAKALAVRPPPLRPPRPPAMVNRQRSQVRAQRTAPAA